MATLHNNEVKFFANVSAGMQKDLQAFEKTATVAEEQFLVDANKAAIVVGKDFKIAAKDIEWAAGEVWKGVEWCYNNEECRDAVEKYGMEAVKMAMEIAEDAAL